MQVDVGARSDTGRVRSQNEDCYCVRPEEGFLVVADGMGGHVSGELASSIAVEAVTTHCLQSNSSLPTPFFRAKRKDVSERASRLIAAIHWANRKIHLAAAKDRAHQGMGTTVVVAWLEGQRLSLAHVGDSRAYLLRSGALEQLTRDHSLAAERERRGLSSKQTAHTGAETSLLLRALGTDEKVEVDVQEHLLQAGDILLLCTDGLTGMVSDSEIASTLLCQTTAQDSADRLVTLANQYGGKDNTTAVVLRTQANQDNSLLEKARRLVTAIVGNP